MEANDLTHDQNDLDYLYRLPKYIRRWERSDDKSRDERDWVLKDLYIYQWKDVEPDKIPQADNSRWWAISYPG